MKSHQIDSIKSFFKPLIASILAIESVLILKKYKPYIIAVTGNVGKTSAKDAIFHVLSRQLFIRKSEKSFNSEIGVPLTILGCDNAWNDPVLWFKNILHGLELILFKVEYPKYLVLEVGADHPGDIRKLSKWLKPDMVVVTRIPEVPVHIEFFSSRGELLEEKACLVQALRKGGTLVLNADDRDVYKMKDKRPDAKLITFGITEPHADFRAENITPTYNTHSNIKIVSGIKFTIFASKVSLQDTSLKGVVGNQHIYPILSALACANACGLELGESIAGISDYKPPKGRMNIIDGMNRTTIIDDTYNSSPVAVIELLNTIHSINTAGRKIAVLGDMLELGKFSGDEHKKVGARVAKVADVLVTVGMRARGIALGARDARMPENKIFWLENSVEAGEFLYKFLLKKDLVFIKGSQGMRMEKAVKEIMANPADASELLVRQDVEWEKR